MAAIILYWRPISSIIDSMRNNDDYDSDDMDHEIHRSKVEVNKVEV